MPGDLEDCVSEAGQVGEEIGEQRVGRVEDEDEEKHEVCMWCCGLVSLPLPAAEHVCDSVLMDVSVSCIFAQLTPNAGNSMRKNMWSIAVGFHARLNHT